jgi:3-(3-hydroxy-phenyl)propionate hydroxylase
LGPDAFERWKALGARFVAVRPLTQLHWTGHDDPDVVIVGDRCGTLKSWFDAHSESVVFLRPDRCIAGACIAQRAAEVSASLFKVLYLTQGGGSGSHEGDSGSVLYVPQPATESSRTVAGSP